MNTKTISQTTERKKHQLLFLLITYALLILTTRILLTKTIFMGFLVWNLFLAIVPYTALLQIKKNACFWTFKTLLVTFVWLSFLPNSFYIITDLVHLTKSDKSIIWLDIPMICLFSLIGFILGLESILRFEEILLKNMSSILRKTLIVCISFLCGFGIYIGRILRFNSWDIVQQPANLIRNIITEVFTSSGILFSIHFGLFIYLIYVSYKFFK
ncbi:MAG: DUF1361 domain-containing protein [Limnohabitans sp.]|nr:DUF1361 domain-containing protein [Limnohabitans sp.]